MKKLFIYVSFIISLFLFTSCSILEVYEEKSIIALNTIISVKFYNEKNHDTYYKKIKEIYLDIENVASQFENNNQNFSIYELNKSRSLDLNEVENENYKKYMLELLNYSIEIKDKTNGYFTPFIGDISNYWKKVINNYLSTNTFNDIDDLLLEKYLSNMNNTSIIITNDKIELIGSGNIDLGAIAKGYATKIVKEYLEENNCNGYLVNAGSSNIIYGAKGNSNFKLLIVDDYYMSAYDVGYVENTNSTLTTSSMGENSFYYNDRYYHHIISPKTAYPMTYYSTINIFNYDPMYADAYTTAMFSMDFDTLKKFVLENELEVLVISLNNIIYNTGGSYLHV